MKKILGLVMVLGVFGVILGGCGSSDTAASGETAGATAGATAGTAGAAGGDAAATK